MNKLLQKMNQVLKLVIFSLLMGSPFMNILGQAKVSKNESFDVKWTNEITEKSTYNDQEVNSYLLPSGEYLTIRRDQDFGHVEIAKFDSSFRHKCSGSGDQKIKVDNAKYDVLSSMMIKSKPHVITVNVDKEEDVTIGAFEVKLNCTIENKGIFLTPFSGKDEKTKMKFAAYDGQTFINSKKPSINFVKSKNDQFGLVYARIGNITQENQKLVFKIVDNNFKEVMSSEIVLPIKYTEFSYESVVVSNDGTAYAIVKKSKGNGKLDNDNRYLLTTNSGKIESNELKLGHEFIRNIKLYNELEDKVQLVATAVNDKKVESNLKAVIISEIDNGNITNTKEIAISEDFISSNKINPKNGLKNFVARNIDVTLSGNYFLTIEQFESIMEDFTTTTTKKTDLGNGMESTWTHSSTTTLENKILKNIIVFNLSPSGELQWSKLIEKEQTFASSNFVNYAGFQSIVLGENLGLVFNDHRDNYDKAKKPEVNVSSLANAVLGMRIVSKDKEEAHALFIGQNEKCMMKAPSFTKVGTNKILLCGNAIVPMGKTTKISKYGLISSTAKTAVGKSPESAKPVAASKVSSDKSIETGKVVEIKKSTNSPANTSAIAHGEARTPSAAVAKNYKYKADEKSVEYYNELRKKFEEEEKVRKEKEALMAIEKAKKEEEVKQGRRLSEDQAPQFDKFRQGEKNPVVKKTTAEEDYKSLFK